MLVMHPFATDSPERKTITLYLIGLAILAAWILNNLLQINGYSIPWWLDAPSPIAIAFIFYEFFDKFFWKWSIFKKLGLVKIPNISGNWEGSLHTSHMDQEYPVNVTIAQSWTEMCMSLTTDQSESQTRTSSIIVLNSMEPILSYTYLSEPSSRAVGTMHSHLGTGILKLKTNDKLMGEYYTGRDRLTFGSIQLRRIPES
jgi:hypothetical protein